MPVFVYIIIGIVGLIFIVYLIISNIRYEDETAENSQNYIDNLVLNGDKITFKIFDILTKIKSMDEVYEENDEPSPGIGAVFYAMEPYKDTRKISYNSDAYFAFEYKGIKFKTHKVFSMDKDNLRLYLSVKGKVDIYILEEPLENEDGMEYCIDDINSSLDAFTTDGKTLYRYYMDI